MSSVFYRVFREDRELRVFLDRLREVPGSGDKTLKGSQLEDRQTGDGPEGSGNTSARPATGGPQSTARWPAAKGRRERRRQSPETTEIYLRSIGESQRVVMAGIEGRFRAVFTKPQPKPKPKKEGVGTPL